MHTRSLSILLLSGAFLAGCAVLNPAERSITVPGHGEVLVAPDVVSVTLGIQTRDADVAAAVRENNQVAAAIIEAARQMGVADSDMQTTYFSVYPQTGYNQFGVITDEVTYYVDNNLTVKLRDVDQLSKLLQNSVNAGATNIYGVTFSIAETAAAEDEARTEAMGDALSRAAQIAVDAGVILGDPITISTGVTLPAPQPYYAALGYGMGGGGGEGPPVSVGTNKVAVDVTVSYSIR